MRPNRVRQLLSQGKTPVGHMVWEFGTRGIAKVLESAGLDFVLIDMEHSGFGLGQVSDLLAWFKATPVTPIVRVPSSDYHFIARVMDAGAQGVMVPNVQSAEQACAVVNALRYAPEGGRGLGLGGSHNDFIGPNPVEYMLAANLDNILICQIESVKGLENLDAIAATPGVDVLLVGHFDLTQSMGIVGQFDHPDFIAALKSVVAAAKKHGIASAVQVRDAAQGREWMALGFQVVSYCVDTMLYGAALKAGVNAVRSI